MNEQLAGFLWTALVPRTGVASARDATNGALASGLIRP